MRLNGENLSFSYTKKGPLLFEDVSISVEAGEIVGLYGPSGCGKTSLGRILAGYALPLIGSVTLNDQKIEARKYNPVQLIFQHPEKAVNPKWKLAKTVNEGFEVDPSHLKALGIEKEWLNRWPNELSGGELQRFCIARALGPETRFLIADEMTTMLDAITQAQIWESVMSIAKKRNIGILVISHEPHLLRRLCTRTLEWEQLVNKQVASPEADM